VPTPVVGNVSEPGWICIDPAAPPIPSRAAVAASAKVFVVTDSIPLTRPFVAGVKITPIEQLPPGARLELQEFCVTLKDSEAATANSVAVTSLLFVIVAACAAVDCPSFG